MPEGCSRLSKIVYRLVHPVGMLTTFIFLAVFALGYCGASLWGVYDFLLDLGVSILRVVGGGDSGASIGGCQSSVI